MGTSMLQTHSFITLLRLCDNLTIIIILYYFLELRAFVEYTETDKTCIFPKQPYATLDKSTNKSQQIKHEVDCVHLAVR